MYIPFNYFSASTVFPRRFSLTPRVDGDVSEVTPGESEPSSLSSTTNIITASSSLDGVTSASTEVSALELITESEGATSGSVDAASTDASSVDITSTSSERDLTQITSVSVDPTSISTSTAPSISAVTSSVEITLATSSDPELTQTSSVSVDPTLIEPPSVDASFSSLSVTTSSAEIASSTSSELELTQATSVTIEPTSIAASSVDVSVPAQSIVLSTSGGELTLVSTPSDAATSAFSVSDPTVTSASIALSPVSLTSEPATLSVTPSISVPLDVTDFSTSADVLTSSIEISLESITSEVASTDNSGPISSSIPVSPTILPLSSVEITSSPSAGVPSIPTVSADAAAPLSSAELSPASNSDTNSTIVPISPSITSALPSTSLSAFDPVATVTAASAVSTSVPQPTSTSGSSSSSSSTDSRDSTDSTDSANDRSSEDGGTSPSSEVQTPEESSDVTSGTATDSAVSRVGSSSDISSDLATSTISSVAVSETVTSITSAATDTATLSDSTSTVLTIASASADSLSVDSSSTSDSTDSLLSTFGSDESLSIVATSTLDSTDLSFSTSDVSETISASASLSDSSAFLTAADSESAIETSAVTGSETDTTLTATLTSSSVDDGTTSFTPVPDVTSTLSTASDDESTLSAASPSPVNRVVNDDGTSTVDFGTVQPQPQPQTAPQADNDPSLTVSTDSSPANGGLRTGGGTTFESSGTAGSPPSTGTSPGNPFPTNTDDGSGTNNTGISANAAKESMAPGTIAGISISVIGSLALVLIIAFLLLRRRRLRNHRHALAHESFGPGILRSNTPSSRHAPSPSGVAFLSSFRNIGRHSSFDNDGRLGGGIGGFFSRVIPWKKNEPGVMKEKGREILNEKPADAYERGVDAGQGSFLPPLAPVKSISPIPPFGAISSSNANAHSSSNANANPFADPSPAPRSRTPVEPGQARTPNAPQGGGAYAAAAAIGVSMPPTGETKDQAPRPDDPFWDPEDLLPPALRLSALKNQAAAWKATSANAPAIPSGSGAVPVPATGVVGAIGGAGMAISSSAPESSRASTDGVSMGGLVPLDPFADPGIQPNNATTNIHPISPIEKSKQEIIPDIFDYRANSSSSAGYDEREGQGHSSWVTQKAWADTGSVRSSTPSSLTSSFYRGQDQKPPLLELSNDKYAAFDGTSSGPSRRSGSSVIASSLGSGIGVDSDSSLHDVSGLPLGLGLGVLRSQSPDSERNNAFGFGFFGGKEDRSGRDEDLESGIDRKRMSNGSGVSGESYETGRYQMFGNAL